MALQVGSALTRHHASQAALARAFVRRFGSDFKPDDQESGHLPLLRSHPTRERYKCWRGLRLRCSNTLLSDECCLCTDGGPRRCALVRALGLTSIASSPLLQGRPGIAHGRTDGPRARRRRLRGRRSGHNPSALKCKKQLEDHKTRVQSERRLKRKLRQVSKSSRERSETASQASMLGEGREAAAKRREESSAQAMACEGQTSRPPHKLQARGSSEHLCWLLATESHAQAGSEQGVEAEGVRAGVVWESGTLPQAGCLPRCLVLFASRESNTSALVP